MVALNSAVWRLFGVMVRIRSTSSRKPRSSISSASSRTTKRQLCRISEARWMRSSTRPTVPTTICPPSRSWACWERIGAPPKTATTSTPLRWAYARSACVTWMHSSRVGVSTSPWTSGSEGSTCSIIGRPKAAVLPEPVWAWPIMSRPSMSTGMACS